MRRFNLPDGTVIDLRMTGQVNGPAQRGGQRFGRQYPWYRVNGGQWHASAHRSVNRFAEWCACCETVADFYAGEEVTA